MQLVGALLTVVDARNRSQIGLAGVVLRETRHTLTLARLQRLSRDGQCRLVTLAKRDASFSYDTRGARVVLFGASLVAAPDVRVRAARKRGLHNELPALDLLSTPVRGRRRRHRRRTTVSQEQPTGSTRPPADLRFTRFPGDDLLSILNASSFHAPHLLHNA